MRAVIREVPEDWLQERAHKGWDRLDEVWEGVLHMVPPPEYWHQEIAAELNAFLRPRLKRVGLGVQSESGLYRPGAVLDFRVPDLIVFSRPQLESREKRRIDGAVALVVEILSPGDETYEKFDFYAQMGVAEIVVIHPTTRAVELYRLAGTKYLATSADDRGRLHAATIDVRFSTVPGPPPLLRLEHAGDSIEF